jgi:hypothetical protein
MAQGFSNVMNSAVSSISDGITGLITGTKTWGQALTQIRSSILNSIIKAIIDMGVQWVMSHLLMQTTSAAFEGFLGALHATSTAQTIALESSKTPVLATNAALSSVSSYGGALAAIGVLAAMIAAFSAGFASGGFTGDGGRMEPAGIVHRGEFVFDADTTSRFRPLFEKIHAGTATAGDFQFAGGASAGRSETKIAVHYWNDKAAMAKHIRENPDTRHAIVEIANEEIRRVATAS